MCWLHYFLFGAQPSARGRVTCISRALRRCSLPSAAVCFFLSRTVTRRGVQVQGSTREINAASAEKGRGLIKICFTIGADHSRTKIITGAMSTDGEREKKKQSEMITFECATPLNKCLSLSHANAHWKCEMRTRATGSRLYCRSNQRLHILVLLVE